MSTEWNQSGGCDLHSFKNGGTVLEARACWVQNKWPIWLDFGCGPSRLGVEGCYHHVIGWVLNAGQSECRGNASQKSLTFPNTRSSVVGSGFRVSALVTVTREACTKIRAVNNLVPSAVLVVTYIEISKGF